MSRGAKSNKTGWAIARIVNKIATKKGQEASTIAQNMATDLSFILLRMELACVRGHRSARERNNTNV